MEKILVKKFKGEYENYLVFFKFGNIGEPLFMLQEYETKKLVERIEEELKKKIK